MNPTTAKGRKRPRKNCALCHGTGRILHPKSTELVLMYYYCECNPKGQQHGKLVVDAARKKEIDEQFRAMSAARREAGTR